MSNSKKRRLKKEQEKAERQRLLAARAAEFPERAKAKQLGVQDFSNVVGFGVSPGFLKEKRGLNGRDASHQHDWHREAVASCNNTSMDVLHCNSCDGIVRGCNDCDGFHAPDSGFGGEASMPEKVDVEWLRNNECPSNTVDAQVNQEGMLRADDDDMGTWIEVPIPFVSVPPDYDGAFADVASYSSEPGSTQFQLEEFSGGAW